MRRALLCLIILLAVASSVTAQERFTSEDMFRWFPEGKYEGALFKNNIAAQASEAFNYLEPLDHSVHYWNQLLLLPDTLKEHWLTSFEMNSVKIVVLDSEKEVKVGRADRMLHEKVANKFYSTNHFGYRLQVINFYPDLNLEKLALSCRGVEKTDETFSTLSVFKCNVDKQLKRSENFYFCITPENEVLACVNPKLLKKMVLTGAGELPSILEDFPFPYLLDMVDDFPHFWQLYDQTSAVNAIYQKLNRDSVDKAEIEKFLNNRNYHSAYFTALDFDFPFQRIMIFIPQGATVPHDYLTESELYRAKISTEGPLKEYSSRYKVGEIEIISRFFTEEYVKAEILRREEYRKEQEAKKMAIKEEKQNEK